MEAPCQGMTKALLGLGLIMAFLMAVFLILLWRLPATGNPVTWYAHHLTQSGIASWYGPRFHGRKTASGERFDQKAMTAAHRTLRFGSFALVTRANGRSVEVRINDRGPFIRGRIIDLSRAAAVELGMMNAGLARVTVTHQRAGAW